MNFKRLSKEKKQQLIVTIVITVVCLAGWGFGLIRYQYSSLSELSAAKVSAEKKLEQMSKTVKQANRIAVDYAEAQKTLAEMESDIASGDLYSWMISTIRRFRAPYKVEIPSLSPTSAVVDVNLLPNFPYKQTSINLNGTAHYHDLGRFIADFENQFPHIRLTNLSVDLDNAANEPEMLAFKMEVVALVKPNAS
jgi:Tfp pilus assembly protein PilO